MLNEGHYLGREGCLFRCGSVPEPGATRLATLAATQKSLLALSRLCGYAMPGQEVNSPRTGAKSCSFLPEYVHLKMLKIEGLSVCKNAWAPNMLVYSKGHSVPIPAAPGTLPPRPWARAMVSAHCSSGIAHKPCSPASQSVRLPFPLPGTFFSPSFSSCV